MQILTTSNSKTITNVIENNNNYILSQTNKNTNNHIMTWTTFIVIILILLLFILGIGCFIFYLNIQIQKLQTAAENTNKKQIHMADNVMPIPQSPSVPSNDINVNDNEGIGKEKPPNIAVELQAVDENIPQPPSAKVINLRQIKKRGSHFGHQQSMEFDVHLGNVVVGDAMVMEDIIDDMNENNDEDDDLVMKSDVETPFSPVGALTPGNYENNLDIKPQKVPDDTEDDTGDDSVDDIGNNDDDDDEYFDDLTPQGFVNKENSNKGYKE